MLECTLPSMHLARHHPHLACSWAATATTSTLQARYAAPSNSSMLLLRRQGHRFQTLRCSLRHLSHPLAWRCSGCLSWQSAAAGAGPKQRPDLLSAAVILHVSSARLPQYIAVLSCVCACILQVMLPWRLPASWLSVSWSAVVAPHLASSGCTGADSMCCVQGLPEAAAAAIASILPVSASGSSSASASASSSSDEVRLRSPHPAQQHPASGLTCPGEPLCTEQIWGHACDPAAIT